MGSSMQRHEGLQIHSFAWKMGHGEHWLDTGYMNQLEAASTLWPKLNLYESVVYYYWNTIVT